MSSVTADGSGVRLRSVSAVNVSMNQEIVDKSGWFSIDLVGMWTAHPSDYDSMRIVFLLIDHC